MKYTLKFYPEKRNETINDASVLITENVPIMASITWAGNRIFHYSGKRCDIKQWNDVKQELKPNQVLPNGESVNSFNSEFSKIKIALEELFKGYDIKKIPPSKISLRYDLKVKLGKSIKNAPEASFFTFYDQFIADADFSAGRKMAGKRLIRLLKEYDPAVTFENLDPDKLRKFMLNEDHQLSENSTISYLSQIKTFILWAVKKKHTKLNAFDSFENHLGVYGTPYYITLAERDDLFNFKFEDQQQAEIRDIFVFQCFIGCRIGDLMELKKESIINGCIEYIPTKGIKKEAKTVIVPLTKKAKAIIEKYNVPGGYLLPRIPYKKMIPAMHKIFEKADIVRNITIRDRKTGLGKQVRICDVVATHMARRCFIGGLMAKDIKDSTIISMTGHVEGSTALARYYTVVDKLKKDAIKLME